eukprot:1161997-Pelagomonas_calceolata.AAC.7
MPARGAWAFGSHADHTWRYFISDRSVKTWQQVHFFCYINSAASSMTASMVASMAEGEASYQIMVSGEATSQVFPSMEEGGEYASTYCAGASAT